MDVFQRRVINILLDTINVDLPLRTEVVFWLLEGPTVSSWLGYTFNSLWKPSIKEPYANEGLKGNARFPPVNYLGMLRPKLFPENVGLILISGAQQFMDHTPTLLWPVIKSWF